MAKYTYYNTSYDLFDDSMWILLYEWNTVSKLKFTRQSMHRLNDELEILYQTTCIKIDLPYMDFKGRYDAEFSKYPIESCCLRCTISDGLFLYYRHE